MRMFERVSGNEDVKLPERSTKYSAGYDMFAPADFEIEAGESKLIPTKVKVYMNADEFVMLCNRSSNPHKKGLVLMNGVGIIDSDYADNITNEGEIGFDFKNISDTKVIIKKGDKLGQAIFMKYFLTDDDNASGIRVGGHGSTGV